MLPQKRSPDTAITWRCSPAIGIGSNVRRLTFVADDAVDVCAV
jgi:hypothetical protein